MAAALVKPRWAAVVVNYRSGSMLADSVAALLADTSAGPVEVVVVDNGSDDGSVERLRAGGLEVTVLSPGANLGYARAANLGIAATNAAVVAVMNPDAIVARGAGAAVLAAFDADPTVAVVGPMITNPDGTVYPSARCAPGARVAAGHALLAGIKPRNRFTTAYRQLDADPTVARDVDWVSGAALWFRRETLDRVGGWDERYFLFLEDVDVCREVARIGGRIRYEPTATVMHVVGVSRAGEPVRSIVAHHRAAYRYAEKWWTGPRRLALPVVAGFLALRAGLTAAGAALRHRGAERPETTGPHRIA